MQLGRPLCVPSTSPRVGVPELIPTSRHTHMPWAPLHLGRFSLRVPAQDRVQTLLSSTRTFSTTRIF